MKMRVKKIFVGAMAALALTLAFPASPAFALNSVTCGNRTDFLKIENGIGNGLSAVQCFANSGAMAVNIGNVYEFTTGNNKVTVNYEYGGQYHTTTQDKWVRYVFSDHSVRVYEVRIW